MTNTAYAKGRAPVRSPGGVFFQTPFSHARCPEIMLYLSGKSSCILSPGLTDGTTYTAPAWRTMRSDCEFSEDVTNFFIHKNRFIAFAFDELPHPSDQDYAVNVYSSWNAIDWEDEGTVPFWPLGRSLISLGKYAYAKGMTGNQTDGTETKMFRSENGIEWEDIGAAAIGHRFFQSFSEIGNTLVLVGGTNTKNLQGQLTQALGYTTVGSVRVYHQDVYLYTETEDYATPLKFQIGCEVMDVLADYGGGHYRVTRHADGTTCPLVEDPPPPHYETPEYEEETGIAAILSHETTGTIFTSTDGTTWTNEGVLPDSIVGRVDVCNHDGALFFCDDSEGKIYKSDDGINWAVVNSTYFDDMDTSYDLTDGFSITTHLFSYQEMLHAYTLYTKTAPPSISGRIHMGSRDGATWARYKNYVYGGAYGGPSVPILPIIWPQKQ